MTTRLLRASRCPRSSPHRPGERRTRPQRPACRRTSQDEMRKGNQQHRRGHRRWRRRHDQPRADAPPAAAEEAAAARRGARGAGRPARRAGADDRDVKSVAANAVVTSHMALTTATTGADAALVGPGGVARRGERRRRGRGDHRFGHRARTARWPARWSRAWISPATTAAVAGATATATARTSPASSPATRSARARLNGAGGMAPGAHLINLRVLGDDGSGQVADVIEALDWAIDNRVRYNIRVINMSLGAPVTQSLPRRPARPGGGARRARRASSWWRRPATAARPQTARRCSAA